MSAEARPEQGLMFTVPPVAGVHSGPSDNIDTCLYVLAYLRESVAGYNNDPPLTGDGLYGLCLILDGVSDLLRRAAAET